MTGHIYLNTNKYLRCMMMMMMVLLLLLLRLKLSMRDCFDCWPMLNSMHNSQLNSPASIACEWQLNLKCLHPYVLHIRNIDACMHVCVCGYLCVCFCGWNDTQSKYQWHDHKWSWRRRTEIERYRGKKRRKIRQIDYSINQSIKNLNHIFKL